MKNIILIAVLSLHIFHLSAQTTWFEEGAKWTYNYGGFVYFGTIYADYEGDTIVDNLILNKMRVETIHTDDEYFTDTTITQLFFYVDSNIVYQYTDDTLKKLYDFNMSEGDTLDYVIHSNFQYSTVSGVDESQIGDHILNIQYLELVYQFPHADTIYSQRYPVMVAERIGHLGTFFVPDYGGLITSEPTKYYLRCYTDNTGLSARGTNLMPDCSHDTATTTDIDNTHQSTFTVYPIPAKNVVIFNVPNIAAADEIILYDITGKQISRQAFPQDKQLAVSHLNDGVYIYRIFYEDEVYSGKIVVE